MARQRLQGVTLAPPQPAAASGPAPSAAGMRSRAPLVGGLAGTLSQLGPRGYLYLLVLIEVGVIAGLRHVFRDHHGG